MKKLIYSLSRPQSNMKPTDHGESTIYVEAKSEESRMKAKQLHNQPGKIRPAFAIDYNSPGAIEFSASFFFVTSPTVGNELVFI